MGGPSVPEAATKRYLVPVQSKCICEPPWVGVLAGIVNVMKDVQHQSGMGPYAAFGGEAST
jgi:hypothetical protein